MELKAHPDWKVDYIAAPPRMAYYIEHSTRIYQSLSELYRPGGYPCVFHRRGVHGRNSLSAHLWSLGARIGKKDNRRCATADRYHGDSGNRHQPVPMQGGYGHRGQAHSGGQGRRAHSELDEMVYRRKLWTHRPLRDFWRVGKGIADKLEQYGIYTMGDIAKAVRQERGAAVPVVRHQCGAADRPCLGMGALHDGIYKSL